MQQLRTKKTQKEYEKKLKSLPENYCHFCNQETNLYKSDFPYDKIAKRHLLYFPTKHQSSVFGTELEKMSQVINELKKQGFNLFFVNKEKNRTFKSHFHLHCIELKKSVNKDKLIKYLRKTTEFLIYNLQ